MPKQNFSEKLTMLLKRNDAVDHFIAIDDLETQKHLNGVHNSLYTKHTVQTLHAE